MSVVFQSQGYLEYDYLTEAYLAGIESQADGVQFRAMQVDRERTLGVQWRQRIDLEKILGLQFRGNITQDAPAGFSFEAVNAGLFNTGLQFLGRNDVARPVGLQSRFLVGGAELVSGVQWEQRVDIDNVTGVQFRGLNNGGLRADGFEFRASRSWTMYQCGTGYLTEHPYLEVVPYLSPAICATGGIQFRGRADVQRAFGVEWQQRVDRARNVGLQWRQQVTQDAATGFQIDAVQAIINGFQFRVAIYNVTNLRILVDFPSRGLTGTNWTASSTAPSSTSAFSANNVNTDIVEQVWRSASGFPGAAILTCDTEVPQGVFVDTLAILNHNFGGNTDVRLERSTNGVAWFLEASLIVERENMYYIAPSLPLSAYRYWRIVVSDSSLDFFQVGTLVFGSAVVMQGECFVDQVKFGKKQFADKVFTEGHTNVANDRGKKRYLGLEFRDLNFGRANFQNLRSIFDQAGTLLKCLYIPTPQQTSRFAVFGKLADIPEETHNTKGDDYVDLNINVDESL